MVLTLKHAYVRNITNVSRLQSGHSTRLEHLHNKLKPLIYTNRTQNFRYLISSADVTGAGRLKQTQVRQAWTSALNLTLRQSRRWHSGYSCKAKKVDAQLNETQKGWTSEIIDIVVGGNGTFSLEINRPDTPAEEEQDVRSQSQGILVYLPPGPSLATVAKEPNHNDTQEESLHHELALQGISSKSLASFIIIKINYRLVPSAKSVDSPQDCRFPMPIHDVSIGFDWILDHQHELIQFSKEVGETPYAPAEAERLKTRISVFGSRIGGSLALMLALTRPNEIHAIAVHDPIVDWVGLDEIAASSSSSSPTPATPTKKRGKGSLEEARLLLNVAANQLIQLRTRLFRNPSGFFDPFASPLMFLRAPGKDTPLWRSAQPETKGVPGNVHDVIQAMKKDGGIEVNEAETREVINERGYGPYDDDWHTADTNLETDLIDEADNAKANTRKKDIKAEQIATDLSALSLDNRDSDTIGQTRELETDLTANWPASTGVESHPQPLTDLSLVNTSAFPGLDSISSSLHHNSSVSPRRRKVLRRWPPVGRPEDVDLPWTNIYSTPPSTSLKNNTEPVPKQNLDAGMAQILHPQAKEMVDVMRKACFWGREKGLGEERVKLQVLEEGVVQSGSEITAQDGSAGTIESKEKIAFSRAVEWFATMHEIEK